MAVVYNQGAITVRIQGLEEIHRRLDQLEQHIQRRMLVDILKNSLKKMMAMAESRAPLGPQVDLYFRQRSPGRLKRSFKIIKVRSPNPYVLEVRLLNSAYYAGWVENGHKLVKKIGGKKVVWGRAGPKPFMRPAFEACKAEVVDEVSRAIGIGLTRRGV